MKRLSVCAGIILGLAMVVKAAQPVRDLPNVILVITDDQGYGDLSCHGNPWLKTPNIDAFASESARFTDFHVSPLCAPTRSAIITAKYPIHNGVWATYKGRDALSDGQLTMPAIFRENGYRTGMFGKWHLGDNYPVRPTDCGFDVAVHHKAGGVGELSDYWGNSYFDDVYYVNNQPKQFEGYCTDVWFNQAMRFMAENKERPFFVYLATNAPHSPWNVAEKYAKPFRKLEEEHKIVSANFYGMIENLDENFGRLNRFLKENHLDENTIVIFMTDNGSSGGISRDGKIGYNAGMRGMKGAKTEGGHRVPFFIRWPNGNITGGKDIAELSSHIDILPTLIDLCGLKTSPDFSPDGVSLAPLLLKKEQHLPERTLFVHHRQDWRPPEHVEQTCMMKNRWRLVNGKLLYDVLSDPHQDHNLANQHTDVVNSLLSANASFIREAVQQAPYYEFPVAVAGNSAQPEITLTIQHAIGEGPGIWKAEQVCAGMKNVNNTHALELEHAGYYEIRCCRWPKECPGPIWGIPKENPKNRYEYKVIKPQKVRISIANQMHEKEINGDENAVVFTLKLPKGKTLLVNDFIEGKEKYGVYYTYVRYLGTEIPANKKIN